MPEASGALFSQRAMQECFFAWPDRAGIFYRLSLVLISPKRKQQKAMRQIIKGISMIEGLRMGRVYVLEAADGLTLVDTSAPRALPAIERDLRSVGHRLSDIKRILITHAHFDHIGSLAEEL